MRAPFPPFLLLPLIPWACSHHPSDSNPPDASTPQDASRETTDIASDSASDANPPDASTDHQEPDSNADAPSDTLEATAPEDVLSHDATEDAPWDAQGRPYGQCINQNGCFWGLPCEMTVPGGACTCSLPDDCGDSFSYDCEDGLCRKLCSTNAQCPIGHGCTSKKWCEPLTCDDDSLCPVPYDCKSGFCARPACPNGESCPKGMSCTDEVCVENYE